MGRVLKDKDLHVVLLAGGGGTRFWPWSRPGRPKQLLDLTGEGTLVELAWRRARKIAPPSRIWVVAPARLRGAISSALPALRADRFVTEPSQRDTGPAIALACANLEARHPGAVAVFLPTDHRIADEAKLADVVRRAAREARRGALVCLGVRPTRPATGFGYLRCSGDVRAGRPIFVERFVEKPALERAKRFLADGRYLWNAGMFVWKPGRFLEAAGIASPRLSRAVLAAARGDAAAWRRAPRRSVDRAVLEKTRGLRALLLDVGWDDLGTWEAAARYRGPGVHTLIDSPGSAVFDEAGRTALLGVPGVIVVRAGTRTMVVARDRAEEVRALAATVGRRRGRR